MWDRLVYRTITLLHYLSYIGISIFYNILYKFTLILLLLN